MTYEQFYNGLKAKSSSRKTQWIKDSCPPGQGLNQSKLAQKPQPLSMQELQGGLFSHFDDVPDPRVNRTKRHLLKDILVIAILSTIAGGDGWEDMENYGISKQQWLQKFLDLPNGIPSDDT